MTTTLHSDVSFEFVFSGVSLGIAQKTMSLHMIKNHIKKQSGHISPPSSGEMLLNSFLKETQKQKWKTEENRIYSEN